MVRRGLLPPRRPGCVPHPRRGRAGRHRRRGLVRRHGTLRPAADPGDLVQRGASRAAHQLLRAGGAAPRGSLRPGQSVLLTWCRAGRSIRWWVSPRPPPSWPPRRSSPAPSPSPARRCSWGTSRGSRSSTPPAPRWARSTSRRSTGPCGSAASRWWSASSTRATWRPPTGWRSRARCSRPPSCCTPSRATAGAGPAGGPAHSRRRFCSWTWPSSAPTSSRSRKAAGSRSWLASACTC